MSANLFTFPSRARGPQPWTNDELAELYRVVDLLGRAGLSVATDMGMSDEGDPWFVFCRVDNEEVIAHFARIDGIFVAASIAVDETFRGANFRAIVDRLVSSQPLVVPPPKPGSRLLLHPAVLLTAFVATALAHSEKMMAQDWLRSVEAQWDHGKQTALDSLKQVKTGWTDTLHTLMKLPLHDTRLAYDSAKEGLTLTLASLIAIAVSALQPIAEKIAIVAQLVDEFPSHAADAAHQVAQHAAALIADASGLVAAGDAHAVAGGGGHGGDGTHLGSDTPAAHKAVLSAALDSSASDGAKASVDAAHLAAPVVQKAPVEDVAPHLAVDPQFDTNIAALPVQKIIAVAAQPTEAIVVHFDTGAVSVPTLDLQDLTADAIHLLNIRPGGTDQQQHQAGAPSPDLTSSQVAVVKPAAPAAPEAPAVAVVQPTDSGSAVANVPSVVTMSGNTEIIDTDLVAGATIVSAVANFVTSGTHGIAQQATITDPIAQQELAGILSVFSTVKVVFFEAGPSYNDVFLYSPGVVFVADKDVASNHLSNPGGNLVLEGGAGGTITLVGVAIVSHSGIV